MTTDHGTDHSDLHSEPPATKDCLGTTPPQALGALAPIARALRADNEFDPTRLRRLLKVATS